MSTVITTKMLVENALNGVYPEVEVSYVFDKILDNDTLDISTEKSSLCKVFKVADNCHFGRNMQQIVRTFKAAGCEVKQIHDEDGQGFLDESGNYLTRSEAYKIASTSGQLFNLEYTLPGNELDSSCIRHFSADKPIEVYSPLCQKN